MKNDNRVKLFEGAEVVHNSRNVCSLYFDNVRAGWEQWFLLASDRHHDSMHCNRELEKKHLEQAKDCNALILDGGDFFDVMQGKFDPRRSYEDLRPEYKRSDMLDEIVRDATKFFAPYAKQFVMIGRGNHDQTVLKNSGTDIISNFVYAMNQKGGHIQAGGYGGWIRFMCTMQGTQRQSINLKYFHGSGGGGPVTRGTIQSNRQAVYQPDAHVIWNGHTHDEWVLPIARERLTDAGVVKSDIQWHVRTSTYKDEYADGAGGWHVETWKPPKPVGVVWMRLHYSGGKIEMEFMQDVQ